MSSRFKSFGFRNKHKPPPNSTPIIPPAPSSPPPSGHSSSTTSLPMNPQQPQPQLGRPPSYTNNRPTSPMVHGQQQPPPITTNLQYNPNAPLHGPPGYGMQQQQQQMAPSIAPSLSNTQYPGRNPAVEVEGGGRSKAQLIVGIDFGTTFSGVAYAFATNNQASEDIITEWPGAGTHAKQKVSMTKTSTLHEREPDKWASLLDSHRPLLRPIPKGSRMGPRYRRRSRPDGIPQAPSAESRVVQASADALRKHLH